MVLILHFSIKSEVPRTATQPQLMDRHGASEQSTRAVPLQLRGTSAVLSLCLPQTNTTIPKAPHPVTKRNEDWTAFCRFAPQKQQVGHFQSTHPRFSSRARCSTTDAATFAPVPARGRRPFPRPVSLSVAGVAPSVPPRAARGTAAPAVPRAALPARIWDRHSAGERHVPAQAFLTSTDKYHNEIHHKCTCSLRSADAL